MMMNSIVALLLLAASATASPLEELAGHKPIIFLNSLQANSLSDDCANVRVDKCKGDFKTYGKAKWININPCKRSSTDEPCTFYFGQKYTIEIGFVSELDAEHPRSSVVAHDPTHDTTYAYSGQSFVACKYAPCPIEKGYKSVYTYHFETLKSPFDYLTFNVTSDVYGSSLFCAGTPVNFVDETASSGV